MKINQFLLVFLLNFCVTPAFAAEVELKEVELKSIASGFEHPVAISFVPGNENRLLVVEQVGKVTELHPETPELKKTFFDLSLLGGTDARTLIDIATHPQYAENGRAVVTYWIKSKFSYSLVIAEFLLVEGSDALDTSTEKSILRITMPRETNEGGNLLFSSDGTLLIGLGDGGGKNDPKDNGQNPQTYFGKILRIDVNKGQPFGVPDDNPFLTKAGGAREVWAWGLHNPHHLAIDRTTGTVLIAERGQGGFEEVNILKRGVNYGWSVYEGTLCLRMQIDCMNRSFKKPLVAYEKNQGKAIVGGLIYRGNLLPALDGAYIYGDQESGKIWAMTWKDQQLVENKLLLDTGRHISALGEDKNGEAFLVDYEKGELLQLVPKAVAAVPATVEEAPGEAP